MSDFAYPNEFATRRRLSLIAVLVTVLMVPLVTWLLPIAVSQAATTTIEALPIQVPDEEVPRGNVGDAPSGFGPDSWQGPFVGKSNWHARYLSDGDYLSALLPADAATMTVGDLASISYFTNRPSGTPAGRDWWIQIYTRPTGSGDKAGWYHDRFINNYATHTSLDAWTQYSTSGAMTFQSNGWGGPVMDLPNFIANHGSELIEMISVQTDSGWNGFDGYIDGLEVVLTNGEIGRVDFTTDSTTIQIAEWEVPDEQRPRVNVGDAPVGFGPDSWQGPSTGKTNWHARYLNGFNFLSDLLPAEAATLTVGDLAAVSYFTKRPSGTPAGRDWWVQVYTRPLGSCVGAPPCDKASWYHDRFINNYSSHTSLDAWTQYSTSGAMTFQSNGHGGPVMDLPNFIANHGSELIEMISVQTDSGWGGFDGYIDGLEVTLTNGHVGRVNFGGDCDVPSTLTFYVDQATGTDGIAGSNPCLNPVVPCATIQHPIDLACLSGGTVNVAAGTYQEQVRIDKKSLNVVGVGAVSTTILAPPKASRAVEVADHGFGVRNYDYLVGVFGTGSETVDISGFTLDGNLDAKSSGPGTFRSQQLTFFNAGGTVEDNVLTDWQDPAAFGAQGVATAVVGSQTPVTVVVRNNTVSGYQKAGIVAYGSAAVDAVIEDNVVTGAGPITTTAQNGIQVSFGAIGSVVGNTVSGNNYTPASWCSAGILLTLSDGIEVRGNTLDANLCDLLVSGSNGNTISGNSIANATQWPFSLVSSSTNTVDKNFVNGAPGEGMYVDGIDNVLTCNRITNNDTGIYFDAYSTDGTPNTANSNVISGNASAGADATSVVVLPPVDGTGNYWGCAGGANTAGCDTAIGNIDATPSAAAEPLCTTCAGAGGDTDDDGVCDPVDNCLLVANAGQGNADADSFGDACDVCPFDADDDIDGDTVCGDVDNCPDDANLGQSDIDTDGIGDVCDPEDGADSMVLSRVKLKASRVGSSKARGKVSITALVQDDQTGNWLPNDLTANGDVRFEVAAGLFTATLDVGTCVQRSARLITCSNGNVKAKFKLLPQGGNIFPNTYKATAKLRRHAGTDSPTGPVEITLRQPTTSIDRGDDISACVAKPGRLSCRER